MEFVFGKSPDVEAFCRAQGWKPDGRATWRKSDDTPVYFTCFVEQLEAVEAGMTVHLIDRSKEALRVLRKVGAKVVKV